MTEFRMRITAQPGDIDDLRHVSNIVYVRWIQDVAVAHSTSVGWAPADYLKSGRVFVVRRHEVEYLRSALEGDEIELVTWIAEASAASCLRKTRIIRLKDGVDLARGETVWVLITTDTGRPQRIPQELYDAFGFQR